MLGFSLIFLLALLLLSYVESNKLYAKDCTTPHMLPGSCMPIKSCARALNAVRQLQHGRNLENVQFLRDSFCGSIGTEAYVCCPMGEIQLNPEVIQHLEKIDCGNDKTRIKGGQCASPFDSRWMAMLVYEENDRALCEGTLIDDQHILTTAHCLYNNTRLPVAVRLGVYDTSIEKNCFKYGDEEQCLDPVEEILIETIVPHENYIYGKHNHDIALIRLQKPVQCKKNISPICLPITRKMQTDLPDNFYLASWGQLVKGKQAVSSNCLKHVTMQKKQGEFCVDTFREDFSNGHICAGVTSDLHFCQPDSGAPLFHYSKFADNVTRSIQYGILSGAMKTNNCRGKSGPSIFTNVGYYMQWITDHMVLNENAAESNCYK